MVGSLAFGRHGWIGMGLGAVLATLLAVGATRARWHLRLDEAGVHVGRLAGVTSTRWDQIAALGVTEGPHGRSGRTLGLAVCIRGEVLPRPVPALTWTASGLRAGRPHAADRLECHRADALAPVEAWAAWAGTPVIAEDLDTWWDRQNDWDEL